MTEERKCASCGKDLGYCLRITRLFCSGTCRLREWRKNKSPKPKIELQYKEVEPDGQNQGI